MAETRPVVSVYSPEGAVASTTPLPAVFNAPIRPDLVRFVHTNIAKNARQAYAVMMKAGHQTSAESWGTGRAVSRIPRISGGGTNRSGQGAFGNMCRKGRMFNPTKVWRHWHRRINTHQKRFAVSSALAASAVPALLEARGHRVSNLPQVPLVVDSSMESFKTTKAARALLEKLGAYADVEHSAASRKVRSGHGKWRNRRHVQRRGPLVVYAKNDGVVQSFRNLSGVDLCPVDALNLLQLAPGGHVGRFVIFSQDAFTKLDALFGSVDTPADPSLKRNFKLPRAKMTNPDVGRLINSDEIQTVVRAKRTNNRRRTVKHNPLRNLDALIKLNPYAATHKRKEYLFAESRRAERAKKAAAKRA